jgi:hypothetical protein
MPNLTGITKEGREGFRFQWIFPAPYQTSKRFKQARASDRETVSSSLCAPFGLLKQNLKREKKKERKSGVLYIELLNPEMIKLESLSFNITSWHLVEVI